MPGKHGGILQGHPRLHVTLTQCYLPGELPVCVILRGSLSLWLLSPCACKKRCSLNPFRPTS
jgi:hypothetical protein